ncbi:helix-turn-helix domain-containing protein [Ancylobacter pratisalsi]|uniref:Chromosomal replication initiator protein DnaA n=1 Tax=Ancylobacter pratisalsi TaxID=1745854 RepID=A0A6P1YHU3_9HYPH|nr:DnaA/Hda family protein [Ancylobacter pratisalsi]QIB32655.1 chromosomal replication initiator protein DnaA [Ancylobacter pratisalsi]
MTPISEAMDTRSDDDGMETLWARIREELRAAIGAEDFEIWCHTVRFERVVDGVVHLSTPTPFLRRWVERRYGKWLAARWREEIGIAGSAIMLRDARARAVHAAPEPVPPPSPPYGAALVPSVVPVAPMVPEMMAGIGAPLDPRMHLGAHIAGGSNALARAAIFDLARGAPLAPLYLHGGTGLGKSHLLQGCAAMVRAAGGEAVYLTASSFTMAVAEAAKQGRPDALHALRAAPLVLIDDVRLITGALARREFAALMRARLDAGMASALAADCEPAELEGYDDSLLSRLGGALVAEITPMERELRLAYVDVRLLHVAPDADHDARAAISGFIAEHCGHEGRQLEGAVNRIAAQVRLEGALPQVDDARTLLAGLMRETIGKQVRIADVQRAVIRHYRVSHEDLLSQRRTANVVRPRQVAMYLTKEMTLRSLPEIGRLFGGRDHTTVLHAVRKVAGLVARDPDLRAEVASLRRTIGGGI